MNSKSRGGMNGGACPLPSRIPSPPLPPSPRPRRLHPSPIRTSHSSNPSLSEELQRLVHSPPFRNTKKRLSKQLSMIETKRELQWEKRRHQILKQERRRDRMFYSEDLTDEDFYELKGSIELGFGFNEEAGHKLCNTLPALDIYFAVNRQASLSPMSSPLSHALNGSTMERLFSFDSPKSEDSWKICSPGESPQQVKTKLRHWAQAVACSVMQCT